MKCCAVLRSFILLAISGCVSSPIGPLPRLKTLPESITIQGHSELPNRAVVITDVNRITTIVEKIGAIRGTKRARYNFNPKKIESLTLTLKYENDTTKLTMAFGKMAVPNIDHVLFYGGNESTQEELWETLVEALHSNDDR